MTDVPDSQPPRPEAQKRPFLRSPAKILALTVVVLVVSALIGGVAGIVSGIAAAEDLEGTDAGAALERLGEPSAYWLTDGPGTPGGDDQLRFEQWFYPGEGITLTFSNGYLVAEDQVTFSQELAETQISPTSLNRYMSRDNTEDMLGEQGVALDDVDTPYDGLEAFAYPRNHLLIGYLDGALFSAQVY